MAVTVRREYSPTPGKTTDARGIILIPSRWIIENLELNNLRLTISFEELKQSSKLSDKILHDLILEYSTDTFVDDGYQYYLYAVKAKKWSGVRTLSGVRREGDYQNWTIHTPNGMFELPLNSPYWGGNTEVDAKAEASYHILSANFFCGKLPIQLLSRCPISGESSLVNPGLTAKARTSSSGGFSMPAKPADPGTTAKARELPWGT